MLRGVIDDQADLIGTLSALDQLGLVLVDLRPGPVPRISGPSREERD